MFKDRAYATSSNDPSLPINSKKLGKQLIFEWEIMLHLDQHVIAFNRAILIDGAIGLEPYHQNFHFHRINTLSGSLSDRMDSP